MPTLVTGATGTIGPSLVRALVARGDDVRVFARPTSDIAKLGVGVEVVHGDVTEAASVKAAMAGCRRVVHLAALYESWIPQPRKYFDVNVGGTVNVLQSALDLGVDKMVHVSSASTIGERKDETGSEDTNHRGYYLTTYEHSKWEAEQFVFEYAAKTVPVTIVNPTSVYGPGDLVGNGLTLRQLLSGKMTASTDTMAAYLFIDDFVEGILAADAIGRAGERYILNSSNASRTEFLRLAAEIAGVVPAVTTTPPWVIKTIAWASALRHRITGKRPAISLDAAAIALHGFRYDSSKAVRELGLSFTSLEDGLDATIDWLYQEGYIDLPEEVLEDERDN